MGYFFFSDIGINSFPSRFSQDDAVFVLFRLRGLRKNDASDGLIENSLKTSLGQSGAPVYKKSFVIDHIYHRRGVSLSGLSNQELKKF